MAVSPTARTERLSVLVCKLLCIKRMAARLPFVTALCTRLYFRHADCSYLDAIAPSTSRDPKPAEPGLSRKMDGAQEQAGFNEQRSLYPRAQTR